MSNPKLTLGIILAAVLLFLAVFGPAIAQARFPGVDAASYGTFIRLLPPSPEHPLGTDADGRDTVAALLISVRPSLLIGLIGGLVATFIGILLGLVSGYAGGWVDTILRTFINMVLVIPSVPIFLILAAFIQHWELSTMALLLGAFGWPYVARVIRAQALSLREREYVNLARITGESKLEIVFFEILPGLLPYIGLCLAGATVGAMLTESGLRLIGVGAWELPTLGMMMARNMTAGALGIKMYALVLIPAALLILAFLSLNLINMGLEERFNPRLRTTVDEE